MSENMATKKALAKALIHQFLMDFADINMQEGMTQVMLM